MSICFWISIFLNTSPPNDHSSARQRVQTVSLWNRIKRKTSNCGFMRNVKLEVDMKKCGSTVDYHPPMQREPLCNWLKKIDLSLWFHEKCKKSVVQQSITGTLQYGSNALQWVQLANMRERRESWAQYEANMRGVVLPNIRLVLGVCPAHLMSPPPRVKGTKFWLWILLKRPS